MKKLLCMYWQRFAIKEVVNDWALLFYKNLFTFLKYLFVYIAGTKILPDPDYKPPVGENSKLSASAASILASQDGGLRNIRLAPKKGRRVATSDEPECIALSSDEDEDDEDEESNNTESGNGNQENSETNNVEGASGENSKDGTIAKTSSGENGEKGTNMRSWNSNFWRENSLFRNKRFMLDEIV